MYSIYPLFKYYVILPAMIQTLQKSTRYSDSKCTTWNAQSKLVNLIRSKNEILYHIEYTFHFPCCRICFWEFYCWLFDHFMSVLISRFSHTIALCDFVYTRYSFFYNLTSTTSQSYLWYPKTQQNSLFTNFPSTPMMPKSLPATSSLQNHKISTFTSTLSIPPPSPAWSL